MVSDSDKYRAHARRCRAMAEKSDGRGDKQMWLKMAATWLGMIPQSQRQPEDLFYEAVRDLGTGQEPSTSQH